MIMPNPTSAAPFTYRDVIGIRHRVVVHKRADDAWQVLDIAVIETLTGHGEGRDAAEALAAHAYWLLDKPIPATDEDQPSGQPPNPIERAHARIIHRLGIDEHGRPNVADVACKDRSRLMRLSGSVNGKTGRHARILEADFELAAYPIEQLVGDLPDPTPPGTTRRQNVRAIREGHVNLAAPLGALTERQRNWLAGRLCQ